MMITHMKFTNSEQGSFITMFAYFWIFIVLVGTIGYVLWTNKQVSLQEIPEPESQTVVDAKKDINRDGKVDEFDRSLVRNKLNCTTEQSCWREQVGKTADGDNPIYTYDLDINGDGTITDADIP